MTMNSERSRVPAAWVSWFNVALGGWLILSPWLVGFVDRPAPFWNTIIVGVLVLSAGLWASRTRSPVPSWLNVALGVWLVLSPFPLGYGYQDPAALAHVVVGIIIGLLGLSAAIARRNPGRRTPA